MKKLPCLLIGALTTILFCNNVFATNLMDVYRKALQSDPTFKAANSQWLATKEGVPIARALLFPQINATGSLARSYNKDTFGGNEFQQDNGNFYNNSAAYSLNLTQPLFNFGNASNLSNAQATAKAAAATFASSAQDLMFRTANSYFNVLLANDVLRVTQEKKLAIAEQLRQTKQKYEVGLIPITDLNDAQASYDSVVSDEISAKKDLEDNKEKLREITAIKYQQLDGLKNEVPLVTPQPNNMERWVKTAENQNNSLLAARFTTAAAKVNIATQFSGHLPTLDFNGSFNYAHNSNSQGDETFSKSKQTEGGVTLNVPIFSGGQVTAQTNQANYQYQNAIYTQEQTHRSVTSNTRQSYLGIISGISKIIADRQGIVSKQSKLRSTQLSYEAGLRTMVDVLQAETDLYDAEKIYYQDQYSYIIETVNLKQLAGTLNSHDLMLINRWLNKANINLQTYITPITSSAKKPYLNPIENPNANTTSTIKTAAITTTDKNKNITTTSTIKTETTTAADQNKDVTTSSSTTTKTITSTKTEVDNQNKNQESSKFTDAEKHLLTLNKNHYTILLLSKDNTKDINQFIKRNGLKNQAFYYSIINDNGDEIYKLVYGDFTNEEKANKWLHRLAVASQSNDSDFKVIQYQDIQNELGSK